MIKFKEKKTGFIFFAKKGTPQYDAVVGNENYEVVEEKTIISKTNEKPEGGVKENDAGGKA